jgi:hypothetical protein
MTIRLPKPDAFDRILRFMGKKRAVYIPPNVDKEFGPYSIIVAKKEFFIKALISSKDRILPKGWVYLDDFNVNAESEYSNHI